MKTMKTKTWIYIVLFIALGLGVYFLWYVPSTKQTPIELPTAQTDTIKYFYGQDTIWNVVVDHIDSNGYRKESIGRYIRNMKVYADSGVYRIDSIRFVMVDVLVSENPDVYQRIDNRLVRGVAK